MSISIGLSQVHDHGYWLACVVALSNKVTRPIILFYMLSIFSILCTLALGVFPRRGSEQKYDVIVLSLI